MQPVNSQAQEQPELNSQSNTWTEVQTRTRPRQSRSSPVHESQQPKEKTRDLPKLRILLAKGPDGAWSPAVKSSGKDLPPPTQAPTTTKSTANMEPGSHHSELQGITGVVGNVSSFFNGIKASFRQDNVYVSGNVHPSKHNLNINKK